jgi:DNA-binding NarL/FixJ family response regulator
MPMGALTIVLADDHHVIRNGLRLLLETKLHAQIVGEGANGADAVALVAREQPDLLIVDVMMPGMNGLEVTRQVRQLAPRTRVLVLSMYGDEAHVRDALRAGATAYVLKDALSDDFIYAIEQAARGQRYLSSALTEQALTWLAEDATAAVPEPAPLTAREREVLCLVAQGHTSADIAGQLVISVRTVDWHRANLLHKLHLHTTADLVRYAIAHGIIDDTE